MKYLKKYKYVLVVFIIVVVFLFYMFSSKVPDDEPIEEVLETIFFDIKGAIVNPGVYEVLAGSRINDAIDIAGGALEDASLESINLSKEITNEMVIIIYTSSEIESLLSSKIVDSECMCPPVISNGGCIEEDTGGSSVTSGKVSINSATIEELMSLTGIGEAKAKAIVLYRETNGLFSSIEDIMFVSGIGEAMFEKIKDHIKL